MISAPDSSPVPEVRLLTEPAGQVADLVTTAEGLAQCAATLAAGSGPVSVDAERAHGFRYSTRAYLIQLRRDGAPTFLVDPIPFRVGNAEADLSPLMTGLKGEWILHAASQDLPCLTQVGLAPTQLFDTELAGRLLGYPRVSLGTLTEELLGVQLLKEHSAADWSTRPLPDSWTAYAALDVELLSELRDVLALQLEESGKSEWARQEFAHLVEHATDPTPEKVEPWRRTSGMHQVRTARAMNVVRELWTARDALARELDRSPGKILPDKAISEAALALRTADRDSLRGLSGFQRRQARRFESNWLAALDRAFSASEKDLPRLQRRHDGPPQPKSWPRRHPEAAARLDRTKAHVQQLSEDLSVPPENLLTPDTLRRLAWQPPKQVSDETVDAFLAEHGARQWQRELLAGPLARLL